MKFLFLLIFRVSFIRKSSTIDVAEDFSQTQRGVQDISQSEGSSSTSVSDTTPEKKRARKRSSPKFKPAVSAAINLAVVLYA